MQTQRWWWRTTTMTAAGLVTALATFACGPGDREPGGATDGGDTADAYIPDADPCPPPPMPAGSDVQLAAPFDTLYSVYDLGPVPGVPDFLGGTVIASGDPNVLLVAGSSENAAGAIYRIGVNRDQCGHIIGWNGTATLWANTPYVDANLVYMNSQLLLYTEWPQYHLSQIVGGATMPALRTDLSTVGMDRTADSGPGGLGIVPPNLPAAGQLRTVTWSGGRWFHVAATPNGTMLDITGTTPTVTLPNNPGGFAYVPAGSPGFANQSLIVAEWNTGGTALDRVAVYEVDDMGDPKVNTRKEFFSKFPRPWGAYFEPVTGDYLFLSWNDPNNGNDRVFIVQGFVPPPPIL